MFYLLFLNLKSLVILQLLDTIVLLGTKYDSKQAKFTGFRYKF